MRRKAHKISSIEGSMLISNKLMPFLLLVLLCLSGFCKGGINLRGFSFVKESGPAAVYEGSQSIYQVLMQEQPANEVTLNLQTEVDGYIRTLTDRLTFNSSNWNETREIVIFGIDDDIIRYSPYGGTLNVTASTNGGNSSSTSGSLTLLVRDTDKAGVLILPKEIYPSYKHVPEGRWGTYQVTLPSIPTETVYVTFRTLSDHITLFPSSMVFTPDLWNTPQQLLVYAVDDNVDMVAHQYDSSFSTSIVSMDPNFHEEPVDNFTVSIEDNDEDESVLSGTLTWHRIESLHDPRTLAKFHLSLTLSKSAYPDHGGAGDSVPMPGMLMYGDETQTDKLTLEIVHVNEREGYFMAEVFVTHEFATANHFGTPWEAVYEHCCRSGMLQNNRKTTLALSVHVDLNHASSPLVPALPVIYWTAHSSVHQRAYYTALAPVEHPVRFSLGTSIDYRSAQAGSPQGVSISSMSGLLSWDTIHVNPGDYSVQIITEDIYTGLRVAAEIILRLSAPSHQAVIPVLPSLLEPVNQDILYISRGSTLHAMIEVVVGDENDPAQLVAMAMSPKPSEFETHVITNGETVNLNISWSVPKDYEHERVIVCQGVANQVTHQATPPVCLAVVIFINQSEPFTIDFNGEAEPGYTHRVTYKHKDSSVAAIIPDNATFLPGTSSSDMHHASVFFSTYYDGSNETLKVTGFTHPSLKLEYLPPLDDSTPSVITITGISLIEVYEAALRHVTYRNTKDMPTVGERVIVVRAYNGVTGNNIIDSYIQLDLEIDNVPPIVKVNGDEASFVNRFFPGNPPVSAIDPLQGLVIDKDSYWITKATVTIQNPLDGNEESLRVFYKTAEHLSAPIVVENTEIHKPFGMLFSGKPVKQISDTIEVTEVGKVGDVDVVIDIRHSWIGDLRLELAHGDRRVLLVLSPGGPECGKHNLFSTTFDTESSDNVELSVSTTSPGLCQYESQGLFTTDESLKGFNADPIAGDWVLHITDLLTNEDSGRLVSWGLVIQPQEDHLVISSPGVVPTLSVGHEYAHTEQHRRLVEADGRILDIAVHVSLGISFHSDHLHMPTMTLVHPDGTEVLLSDGANPLCAFGNYTRVIFDDRASDYSDYSCERLYNETIESMEVSGSGSGSGDSTEWEPDSRNIFDLMDMNITIPKKLNLIDVIPPATNFSTFRGKQMKGVWTLVIHSDYPSESRLLGWSVKVSREANIDSSYDPITGALTLQGEDSAANYQQVLRTIHYDNSLPSPNFSEPRMIASVLFDGQAYSDASLASSISQITVHHVIIDLDPLDASDAHAPNYIIDFVEHGPPVSVVDHKNALLADPANSKGLYSLVITLSNYGNGHEEGLLVNTSAFPNITVEEYSRTDTNEKSLILNISSTASQPLSNFQTILRSIEYFNNAEEFHGSNREIQFVVFDFINGNQFTSQVAITTINLIVYNDPPVLILNLPSPELPFKVNYTERQEPVSIIDQELGFDLYDYDDDSLSSITVKITNAQDGDHEILEVNETLLNDTWIVSDYNVSSHTLTLYGIDSIDNYTQVLSTITYDNTNRYPGDPDTTMRIITFIPNDGNMDGLPNVTLVSFSDVNDPPFVDLNGMTEDGTDSEAVFKEELGAVKLSPKATIFDIDNDNLAFMTIRITNALDRHSEVVSVTNGSDVRVSKGKVIHTSYTPELSYDQETSTLTITGLASVHAYQQVLRTLTYDNMADEPHPQTRKIEVIAYDGIDESDPVYCNVIIDLINDSPRIDHNATAFTISISEDQPDSDNDGFAVSELEYLMIDDDLGSAHGIAVIQADPSNGVWKYTNGGLWTEVDSDVSLEHALILSTNTSSRLRYLPNKDFNGNVSLLFVAWDMTDDREEGTYLNARSTSVTDPFSDTSSEVTVIVVPVNDAPVLLPITINLTTILEDDYTSAGDTVLTLLEHTSDVDISSKDTLGVAVVSAEQVNGAWQYTEDGGDSWSDFGNDISYESALLLAGYPVEDNRVRFVPHKDYNGFDQITFLAWDLTYAGIITVNSSSAIILNDDEDIIVGSGSSSGSGDNDMGSGAPNTNRSDNITAIPVPDSLVLQRYVNTTLSDPVTGPLSVDTSSAIIITEPVNDSPTVTDGMTMESIQEDIQNSTNHGTEIKKIINGYYGDVDAHPMKGLAIVEVNNEFGLWQYRCNITEEWQDFIGDKQFGETFPLLPRPEKATLLLDSCWIRFVPDEHFNTEYDYNHHPRPSSDTPYITAHGWDNTGLTEGLSGSFGNDASYANTSITNEYSSNTVAIPISVTTVNDVPILWLANGNTSKFATTFYEDLESVPAVGEGLVLIDNDHARLRNVTITIRGEFDQSPYNETELNSFIDSITEEDYYDGHDNFTDLQLLQDFVRTTIPEPTQMELYCAGLEERTERLLVDLSYLDLVTEITSYCPFTMHIYPNPEYEVYDADVAMFQKALQTVRYNNSVQEPLEGERSIEFIVYDDFGHSLKVYTTIDVVLINDAPILDINDYIPDINNFVTYYEGDEPLLLTNHTGLRLVDFDNHYLQYAQVILVEAPDTINETLTADTEGTQIIADYENYTLYLTGNDTVENYAKVLSTVTYYNNYSNPGNPDQRDRIVYFIVSDGEKENLPAQATINFYGINDRPSIDVNGDAYGVNYTTTFREEEGPVHVTSQYTILVDEDNATLTFVMATILNPLDGVSETLSVSYSVLNQLKEKHPLSNINVTFNQTISTLTISGLEYVSDYKLLLKTVMYNNDINEFMDTDRIIKFIASDGLLISNSAHTTVKMMPINDSPYFNDESIIVPHIYEDTYEDDGDSVYSIAQDLIEDDDSQYMSIDRGIAVIGVETDHGHWEYNIDDTTWSQIPANTSLTYSLLLDASHSTLVRFVPDKDFNGNASMSFVAWDGVDGLPQGSQRVAMSLNNTDPFSEEVRVLTVVVVPVNDAPVLNESKVIAFPSILEDDVIERPSNGQNVSIFFPSLVTDVDQDYGTHEFGVAIVEADQTNGYWQVTTDAGVTWKNISSPSLDSATVLRSKPDGQHRVRFAPFKDFNGETSLKFRLWDLNVTFDSGTQGVNTNTDPVTGTFSVKSGTATLTVDPVNDSPVLGDGIMLAPINEDPPLNYLGGEKVYSILHSHYTDVDLGIDSTTLFDDNSNIGVAVVGVDNRFGVWQYTCDSGNTEWDEFRGGDVFGFVAPRLPIPERGTLLSAECRIRFRPETNFNTEYDLNGDPRPVSDMPWISLKGWDNTGVTEGLNEDIGIDTTSDPDDHTNSFSEDIRNATIVINSINDVPEILVDGSSTVYTTTFTEPLTPNRTIIPVAPLDPDDFVIADIDNARARWVTVTLVAPLDGLSHEYLTIDTTNTTNIQVENSTTGEGGFRLALTPVEGIEENITQFNTAIRTILYVNSAEEPDSTPRTIEFRTFDGVSVSTISTTTIHIQLVNDPPEIDLNTNLNDTYNMISYSEGQGPELLVDPTLSLIDYDNTTLDHVTVIITNPLDGEAETLTANSTSTNVTLTYVNGTLLMQGPDTIENFRVVLLTVKYNNSLSHPGHPSDDTRIIAITANDGLDNSFTATAYLYFTAINNLPILDLNGASVDGVNYSTMFTEEQGPVSALDSEHTVLVDVDNTTLAFVEVVLTNPLDGSLERLWVDNVTEYKHLSDNEYLVSEFNPVQYYNHSTATLRITGLDEVYQYQEVLRTLKYDNKADEPTSTEDRLLLFRVSDGVSIRTGVSTTISIQMVNDSPYVNNSAQLYEPSSYEDISDRDNIGWSLYDLASNWILDDDQDAVMGVAVVATDINNGKWEYTLEYRNDSSDDEGMSGSGSGDDLHDIWSPIPDTTSVHTATVLRVNEDYHRIRFVPDHDFNGEVTLTLVAWDATDGLQDGSVTDAMSSSPVDPFSYESVRLTVTVVPVNDAPVLDGVTVHMRKILEDNPNEGDDVSLFVSGAIDIDGSDPTLGIAVVSVDESNGSWEFTTDNGHTWEQLTDVSVTSATLLGSESSEANRIRFVPSQDYNGYASLTFLAWDLTSHWSNGMTGVDTTSTDWITGPFSITSAKASIYIEAVNDSPVVEEGMSITIYEDITESNNTGSLVKDFVQGLYTDVDAESEVGVAVVGVNIDNGKWQYQCPDFDGDWKGFIGDMIYGYVVPKLPRPEKATILSGDCRVRFLPNLYFNTYEDLNGDPRNASDIPYIEIKGWDNTGITEGKTGEYGVDTTHGNQSIINELSSDTVKVHVYIESINNPPELNITAEGDGKTYQVLFTEDDPYVRIVDPLVVSIIDVDNATLHSVTIELTNVHDPGDELIDIDPSDTTVDLNDTTDVLYVNISGKVELIALEYDIFNDTDGVVGVTRLTLHSHEYDTEVSKGAYEEAIRHLVYINDHPEPVNKTRVIVFHVDDGINVDSTVHTYVEYKLLAENHPVLTTHLYELNFTEGDPSPVSMVSPSELTLTDEDHNEFFYISQALITLSPVPVSALERVSVDTSLSPSVSQNYDPTTGKLLVQGDAPVSVYQDILRTAVYDNVMEEPPPGLRNISIVVLDAHGLSSNTEYIIVSVGVVNDRHPVVTTAQEPFYYREHRVTSLPNEIPVHQDLTVSDPDSGDLPLEWIEIQVTNPLDGTENEILSASETNLVMANYSEGILTLMGPAKVSDFQDVLSTLTYVNTAEEPTTIEQRIITVVAFDGLLYSTEENISVVIIMENDPPVVDLNGEGTDINYITEYVEGGPPVSILNVSEFILTDNDNTNLTQVIVKLFNIYDHGKEVLAVEGYTATPINVSYSVTDGVLRLTGNAPIETYINILRTATYSNLESDPGNPNTTMRRISFTAYDQLNSSVPAITYMTFQSTNDAPFLDLNGNEPGDNYTTTFIEEGDSVTLSDENMTLFDIDSNLLAQVRVRITNCPNGSLERLLIYDHASILDTFTLTSAVCELNVTGLGAVDVYEDVISRLMYQNVADEPEDEARVIEIIVNDGVDDSEPRYTTVSVMEVNDPPRLQVSPPPGIYRYSDFIMTNTTQNMTTPPTVDGSGDIDVGSGIDIGSGVDMGSAMDGMFGSGDTDVPTTDTPTDTPPTMPSTDNTTSMDNMKVYINSSIYSTQYVENGEAVLIVEPNFVKIEDDDNSLLSELEVTITNVLDEGFETLFISQSSLDQLPPELSAFKQGFTLAYGHYVSNGCPLKGPHHTSLNIDNTLTIQQMTYIIQALHYCNTDNDPVEGDRNITFRIRDFAGDWSSYETSTVTVTPVNDAPIYNTTILFNKEISTMEDHNVTIPVLHLFYDYEEQLSGDSITITDIVPDVGTATVNPVTGDITYHPAPDDYGVRIVSYKACDSNGACSTPIRNLTITVVPVNDPPYIIGSPIVVTLEDTPIEVNLIEYFGDIEDNADSSIVDYPKVAVKDFDQLTLVSANVNDESVLIITPRVNAIGEELMEFEVCDSSNSSCVDLFVTIRILPVNDIPEIDINNKTDEATHFTTNEDTTIVFNVTFYDVESNLSTPIIGNVVDHGNGKVTMTTIVFGIVPSSNENPQRIGNRQQVMSVSYTPSTNFYGKDTIVVSATDFEGGSVNTSITINVLYVNDQPHFGITEVTTTEDTPLEIQLPKDLNVTDPEDVLHAGSFKIVVQPSHGSLTYSYNDSMGDEYPPSGTLLYTPNLEYFTTLDQPESFRLQACDHDMVVPDQRLCINATITVTVASSNDPPFVPTYSDDINEEEVYNVNLIEKIIDVEDGQPPVDKVTILDPLPENGNVVYNSETGFITYTPNKDFYGVNYIHFESCDTEGSCNSSGLITINVLDVNDPPTAMDITAIVREDVFELIDIHMYTSDSEDDEESLMISIVDSQSGEYMSEGELTLQSGARLRVYQEHGIVTYEPKENFVGEDTFRYAICDTCDIRRDAELGRTSFDEYPQCAKQLEQNGGSRIKPDEDVDITCDEALVRVKVINEPDVPQSRQLSGRILQNETLELYLLRDSRVLFSETQQYLYSNENASVFDVDDQQSIDAQMKGLNLTEYGLSETTDIDESSLKVGETENGGSAQVGTTSDGLNYIVYQPIADFSGYDSFSYTICDIARDNKPPRCVSSIVQVFVPKPGPKIVSLIAEAASGEDGYEEDSRVSKGDKIVIRFDQATNMPPHQKTNELVEADDIDRIFTFPQGFVPSQLYGQRYTGTWTNVDQFVITITNEGYPQPENKIGNWTVGIQEIDDNLCGGIDPEGRRIIAIDNCLLSDDLHSSHSVTTSPPIEGNWGLRLPEPVTAIFSNQADESREILAVDSLVTLFLREPFSHNQLVLYCSQDPADIFDYSVIGTGVRMTVVGCENTLVDSRSAFTVYENQIEESRKYFEVLDYADAAVGGRSKRQVDNTITEQPTVSKIQLQITSITELSLSVTSSLKDALNRTTMARVVSLLSGVNASEFIDYETNVLPPDAGRTFQSFIEQNNALTPRISDVNGNDPDCLHNGFGNGDTFSIEFNTATDEPNIATKEDIDKIFVFENPIGTDYEGFWESPTKAVIKINRIVEGSNGSPGRISFTPNYLDANTIFNDSTATNFPTTRKHCYGINVCGTGGPSIGICDSSGLSCRAYEPILVGSVDGYDGGTVCTEPAASIYWVYILIAFVVLIVIVLLLLLVYYCYRKNKQKRQKEEAMRVVERWHKSPKSGADSKDVGGTAAPWAKPPDVFTMRDQTDPFSNQTGGPLKNLPEMVRRPPTAAAGENLPSLDTIPVPFVPRTGARIVPDLPSTQPTVMRNDSLPSLTPLGLPRITRQSQVSVPPIADQGGPAQLGPLQGPLHMYARRTSGPLSPTTAGPIGNLPGVLRPNVLPPLQQGGVSVGGAGLPSRRISGTQLPPLPSIGPPLTNRITPLTTSSDENNTSTSELDTEEGTTTTSDGSQKPLLRQSSKPILRPSRPSNLSIGPSVPPLSPTRGVPPLSPPGSLPPSMPLRKPSVDPFAKPPPLTNPTSGPPRRVSGPLSPTRPLPPRQPLLGGLPTVGPSLRAPPLPSIPGVKPTLPEPNKDTK